MFCTNEPCENETIPESGALRLCRTCHRAWRRGFRQWSQAAIQATTYHARDSLLIRLPKPFDETLFPDGCGPEAWPPENTLPFKDLFGALPPNCLSCGFLELGKRQGEAYEAELSIPFFLGPDFAVWAEVGDVEDLPTRSEPDREALAGQMLDEFLEATQDWFSEFGESGPTAKDLHLWPVPRVMFWLQQLTTLHSTDSAQRRLITGLQAELRALGFQPKP